MWGYRGIVSSMQNQARKDMEREMETGVMKWFIGISMQEQAGMGGIQSRCTADAQFSCAIQNS